MPRGPKSDEIRRIPIGSTVADAGGESLGGEPIDYQNDRCGDGEASARRKTLRSKSSQTDGRSVLGSSAAR